MLGDACRLGVGDIPAVIDNLAGSRRQELGQQIEKRGLARPIGAYQGMDRAGLDTEIDVLDGGEALEVFGEAAGFQNSGWFLGMVGHGKHPRLISGSRTGSY